MSLFGLHRWLRGAAIGHFASTEITSPPGSRRMVEALQRMEAPSACVAFYREHVEADAVHEQVVRLDVVGDLVAREPQLDRDVVFGIRAHAVVENRLADNIMASWKQDQYVAAAAARLADRAVDFRCVRHRRWLVSHNGYSLLRRQVQIATMNRSDSTTRPSGISMRTGPDTSTGPVRYHLHPGGGHGFSARITTSSSSRQPRRSRPVSSSHSARADNTGPNGIHWEAMTSASMPVDRKRVQRLLNTGECRLDQQQGSAVAQQI